MAGHRLRTFAVACAIAWAGPVLVPAQSGAAPRTELTCAILSDPEELSSLDAEDFVFLISICPGQIGRVHSEEKRKDIETPTRKEKVRESELEVHRIRPTASTPIHAAPAPSSIFSIKEKKSTEVTVTPTSRLEKEEEETEVRAEGYRYTHEESTETFEDETGESVEKESEENISSR
jgi:hypothetical protein